MKRYAAIAWVLALLFAGMADAGAMDYVSVADDSAIMYDAPSIKAKKLFVVSRYTPLEQVVSLQDWVKARDSSGSLAWIERRALSNKRYVTVIVALAAIRQSPDENAAVVAQAKQQVALERLESTGTGWLKVRHQDGATGYIRTTEAWGD
jgi:SH3 domain protein